jgi:hypothetical protein
VCGVCEELLDALLPCIAGPGVSRRMCGEEIEEDDGQQEQQQEQEQEQEQEQQQEQGKGYLQEEQQEQQQGEGYLQEQQQGEGYLQEQQQQAGGGVPAWREAIAACALESGKGRRRMWSWWWWRWWWRRSGTCMARSTCCTCFSVGTGRRSSNWLLLRHMRQGRMRECVACVCVVCVGGERV